MAWACLAPMAALYANVGHLFLDTTGRILIHYYQARNHRVLRIFGCLMMIADDVVVNVSQGKMWSMW